MKRLQFVWIKETTVAGVWSKLDNLYITRSLANTRLFMKQMLYSYRFTEYQSIVLSRLLIDGPEMHFL